MSYDNGVSLPLTTTLNSNNDGFGSGDGWWIIILLLALGGWGNGGAFGGNFGGMGGFGMYPWLANGQQEIMSNTNYGFDTLHLSNQIEGVKDGVGNLATQICNGFSNAEISANARQMADMNQNFNNQIATMQGFNELQSQLAQCCCDNRLATCQTQNIIQNEGNATRFADANNTRDIIESANKNSQAILDKLCQLELDNIKAQVTAKDDIIAQLRQENLYARGQASQIAQTAEIRLAEENQFENFYNRLKNCPVNAVAVYGNQPVFGCTPNINGGCGCNGNNVVF